MIIRKLYRKLYQMFWCKINPIRYARKIGVNFPENELHVYGKIDWGTEPWIITLGNNVHITDDVKFITHDGGTLLFRSQIPDIDITKPIILGDKVYIGNNVILLPGVTIGNNVIIGAGAIVSRSIPDNSVAVCIPARVIKGTDEYLKKIIEESTHFGHLKYKEKDDALKRYFSYNGKSKGLYF
jgi:acetyltransferase-like isoleucine patch superfamily enzyme